MPHGSEIEIRDRAIVAFALMTGAGAAAISSMQLGDVDLADGTVEQDARHVKTKFRKSFPTYFMQVRDDIFDIFADWLAYLRAEKLWRNGRSPVSGDEGRRW